MKTTESTLAKKANRAVRAAADKSMEGVIWTKDETEVRVYLRRTNAARTEAGYIRFWVSRDAGNPSHVMSKYVFSGSGTGSRTAESEGESVYARYKALLAEEIEAKNVSNI